MKRNLIEIGSKSDEEDDATEILSKVLFLFYYNILKKEFS